MPLTANDFKLQALNDFRAAEGKAPFADWRNARHQPMLDAYLEARNAARDEANAKREAEIAAKQAKLDKGKTIEKGEVVKAKAEKPEVSQEEIKDVINSNDFGNKEVAEAFKGKKQPSYKHLMAKSGKTSLVDKPVGFVHQFLANHPELSRKEAVAALVEYGVNYATARTQYQRWFSGRK